MYFRTIVDLPGNMPTISHQDEILLLGSCFSEHIGDYLTRAKFRCDVNPFGILYNPQSILVALQQILAGKEYTASDLFCSDGIYRSFMHHSSFASACCNEVLDRINTRIRKAHERLPDIHYLMLTLGTSWVFTSKEKGNVVSNCHKIPADAFERKRLGVEEIVSTYTSLIEDIRAINPNCKLLFTLSPIRHLKDGAHGNQLSKSILLLAVDQLQRLFPGQVFYFPAYEIVLDELRDYRFYADDMTHPSSVAVAYVWERFSTTFFSEETQSIVKECLKINKSLLHKPFDTTSEGYIVFLKQLVLKIDEIAKKYPNLDLEKEKKQCRTLSNQLPNR